MIFTQEVPLTRKWFSGWFSCIRSNWNKLGVNFEEGGNWSALRKPSKSGWDRLKLNPHKTFVVEVEGVIGVHYASLTSQIAETSATCKCLLCLLIGSFYRRRLLFWLAKVVTAQLNATQLKTTQILSSSVHKLFAVTYLTASTFSWLEVRLMTNSAGPV